MSSGITVKELRGHCNTKCDNHPLELAQRTSASTPKKDTPADVMDDDQQTNAIRVTDESASGYNTAIVELLNRFGITP